MACRDLMEILDILKSHGELKKISFPVSPVLEISEITDKVTKRKGPALFFEKVEGHVFPVVTNLFGSEERMRLAFRPNHCAPVVVSMERSTAHSGQACRRPKVAQR